jgi:hypothetical protein
MSNTGLDDQTNPRCFQVGVSSQSGATVTNTCWRRRTNGASARAPVGLATAMWPIRRGIVGRAMHSVVRFTTSFGEKRQMARAATHATAALR